MSGQIRGASRHQSTYQPLMNVLENQFVAMECTACGEEFTQSVLAHIARTETLTSPIESLGDASARNDEPNPSEVCLGSSVSTSAWDCSAHECRAVRGVNDVEDLHSHTRTSPRGGVRPTSSRSSFLCLTLTLRSSFLFPPMPRPTRTLQLQLHLLLTLQSLLP